MNPLFPVNVHSLALRACICATSKRALRACQKLCRNQCPSKGPDAAAGEGIWPGRRTSTHTRPTNNCIAQSNDSNTELLSIVRRSKYDGIGNPNSRLRFRSSIFRPESLLGRTVFRLNFHQGFFCRCPISILMCPY